MSPSPGVTAGLNFLGSNLGFLSTVSSPLSNQNLNPATYLDMDNGLNFTNTEIVVDAIDDIRYIDSSIPPKSQIEKDITVHKGIDKYI